MVQIDISTMSAGIHELTLHPRPDDLGLSDDEFGEIQARTRLDVGDQQILARLQLSAEAKLTCDRTLIPFIHNVEGDFTVMFTKRPIEPGDTDEAVKYLSPSARELDVTGEMRDTILLAVPLRAVAPEALEADLQLTYGSHAPDSAVDPRWDALRKLKSDSAT
jgi:uncharacterized protein